MKKLKKLLSITLLTLSVVSSSIPIQNFSGTNEVAQAASIKLSKSSLTLYVGKSATLKVTGTKSKAKWSSSNKSVATVSSKGKVIANMAGTATISAKVGKKTLKCKVVVKENINKLVYEDSNVRIFYTGMKKDTYPDTLIICFTIENISDNRIEICSGENDEINGEMIDATLYQEMNPKCKARTELFTMDDAVVNIPLSDISSIKTSFTIWNKDSDDDEYYETGIIDILK